MGGSPAIDQGGTYGTKGVADSSNWPGGRTSATGWAGDNGTFWLFGGGSAAPFGNMNDLWNYNPANGLWTWVHGSNGSNIYGIYGTMGTAGQNNVPGSRWGAAGWTDLNGKLWLFGGVGQVTSANPGGKWHLSDLWMYDPSSNMWTWMHGNSTPNGLGNYSGGSTAKPGGRNDAVVFNHNGTHFFLFGGFGFGASSQGMLNDMWVYSVASNTWQFLKGSSSINQYGQYGSIGVENANNTPCGRESAMGFAMKDSTLWLFGGSGTYNSSTRINLRDIWRFNLANNQWTWIKGEDLTNYKGVYIPEAGMRTEPGARQQAATWTDPQGNRWLFGGIGYGSFMNPSSNGYLDDLWKFDKALGKWILISGSNRINQAGIYGTKGIPEKGNRPGGRQSSAFWSDTAGNLWLFGGFGWINNSTGYLNDLWKFTPATGMWTWVGGSNTANSLGTYGSQGTTSSANFPGARMAGSATLADDGNLWLFGGSGYATSGTGNLNDLWHYNMNTNLWTWIKGSNGLNQNGIYGTQGTAGANNTPGARNNFVLWTDSLGQVWLFGGNGGSGYLNDLWKYNPSTNGWTWMKGSSGGNSGGVYGTMGTAATNNTPGARTGTSAWRHPDGTIWLFGGYYYYSTAANGHLNDVWKYDPSNNLWTWMKGSNTVNARGNYYEQNQANNATTPGAGSLRAVWSDKNGEVWVIGGQGYGQYTASSGLLNDEWHFNPATNQWTWLGGKVGFDHPGIYGTERAILTKERPGSRMSQMQWTDKDGNFWLFGGNGNGYANTNGLLSDLWKFNEKSKEWTYVKGPVSANQYAVYGNMGTADDMNRPGARNDGATWADTLGNLWLLGGQGIAVSGAAGYLNDLWKYEIATNRWTWMKGSDFTGQSCVYGTKGVPAPANMPGGRSGPQHWKDKNGNLWLYGGFGHATSSSTTGYLSDLWMYSPQSNQWKWVKGNNSYNANGNFGTQGVADTANNPPSLLGGANWTDNEGNLWMFSGTGGGTSPGYLNALWRYEIADNRWTWLKGSSTTNALGVYGNIGVADDLNIPGSRSSSNAWTDDAGDFWLFGGYGNATTFSHGHLNDLWKYSPASNRWTWVSGSNAINQRPVYGTMGISKPGNQSGGRLRYAAWKGSKFNLWLFGGDGWAETGSAGRMSDMWRYVWHECNVTAAVDSTHHVLCNGKETGSISVKAANATGLVIYKWSNGASVPVATGLAAGIYSVTIEDILGCTAVTGDTITQPPAIKVNISATREICAGEANGEILASVNGGVPPYHFLWNNQDTALQLYNLKPGVYSLTVIDSNACQVADSATVQPGNPLPQPDLGPDTTLAIGASFTLRPGTFHAYKWSTGSTQATINVTTSGIYWVEVYDKDGCMGLDSIKVEFVPVGIQYADFSGKILMYPNPASASVMIETTNILEQNTLIEAFDALGKLTFSHKVTEPTNSVLLNLSGLSIGVYTICISHDTGKVFLRLVVN